MRCAKNNLSRESRLARRVWRRWRCNLKPEKWCCFHSKLMIRAFLFILNINHKQFDDFTTKKMFLNPIFDRSRGSTRSKSTHMKKNHKAEKQARQLALLITFKFIHTFQRGKWVDLSSYFSVLSCFSPLHIVFS